LTGLSQALGRVLWQLNMGYIPDVPVVVVLLIRTPTRVTVMSMEDRGLISIPSPLDKSNRSSAGRFSRCRGLPDQHHTGSTYGT
jgi:hypothetical protein